MLTNRTALKLSLYPDSILRKKTRLVNEFNDELRRILKEMAQIMYINKGVGLAANQVGLDLSILVADAGEGIYKLVNPKIVYRRGRETLEEGCLSLPNICVKVKRAKKIIVNALDEYGKTFSIEADGLLGRIFQHEIDHLNGKLIIDYATFFEKIKIKSELKKINKKNFDERLCK